MLTSFTYSVEPHDEFYLSWLRAKTCNSGNEKICTALTIRESKYGRGLYAMEFIQKGDVILRVPWVAQLSPDNLPPSIGNYLNLIGIGSDMIIKLVVTILYEIKVAGPRSSWLPYIARFPKPEEMISTAFWTSDELKMIAPSFVHQETVTLSGLIQEYSSRVKAVLPATQLDFTDDEFKHAYLLVKSRALIGRNALPALVPYLDLLNHDSTSESVIWNDEGNTLVEVDRDYAPGEEVMISYGKKSNSMLLLNYGFTSCSNPHDFVVIIMSLDKNDKMYARKHTILEGQPKDQWSPPSWNHFKISKVKPACEYGIGLPILLRAFARIAVLDNERELKALYSAGNFDVDGRTGRHPLKNKEKEIEAHHLLKDQISQMLNNHIAHINFKLPPTCELTEMSALKKRLAVDLLQGEIEVLKTAQDWLTHYLCKLNHSL